MTSREFILSSIHDYSLNHHSSFALKDFDDTSGFEPGVTTVPYAGRVFGHEEVEAASSAVLDFWLTLGPNGRKFESKFSRFLGVSRSILTNSGSSANLLALSALTSHKLGERRLLPGDEVITSAVGFPTTVAPIIQNGLVPVFADNDPTTLNIKVDDLPKLLTEKTRAIFVAHTLGNPFDLQTVIDFCKKHNLYLIEDNCDALSSTYAGSFTGTFGDLSTQSFYPPHHITMGEGGMINISRDSSLLSIVESFRDWGRDCWCPSGVDNSCGKRFDQQLGDLPFGYDHKFTYSHWGYNLKPLDVQAAIGLVQLSRLEQFTQSRIRNWLYLRKNLEDLSDYLYFSLPTHAKGYSFSSDDYIFDDGVPVVQPSWFGFMIGLRPHSTINKRSFAKFLDSCNIHHRMLFGGNLLRQPVVHEQLKLSPNSLRAPLTYTGADDIMSNTLFVGTYPGLRKVHLDYLISSIKRFIYENK